MNIGFSTGYLNHKLKIPLKEVITLCLNVGANATELSCMSHEELTELELDEELIKTLNNFDYVSIHAPSKGITYAKNKITREVMEKLNFLTKKLPIKSIVVHPSVIEDFFALEQTNLPIIIENMDKRHEKYTTPQHFQELKEKHHLGFVLDLQHAFEHDPTMRLCKELIEVMGDNLKEMHVSGYNKEQKHAPVHLSDNKEAISKILKLKPEIPIILEGCISDSLEETAREEINYIKSFYN